MTSDQPVGARSHTAEHGSDGAHKLGHVDAASPRVRPSAGLDRVPASSTGDEEPAEAVVVSARGLALLDALERHAPGARAHADAVATYAFATAAELGLRTGACELVREVARLQEVGRLYLPPELALRPRDEMSAEEHSELEHSRQAGSELARGAGLPQEACRDLGSIDERFDDRGPSGIGSRQIPLPARIARVTCAYQEAIERFTDSSSLVSEAPRQLALAALRGEAGMAYDDVVIKALSAVVTRAAATR